MSSSSCREWRRKDWCLVSGSLPLPGHLHVSRGSQLQLGWCSARAVTRSSAVQVQELLGVNATPELVTEDADSAFNHIILIRIQKLNSKTPSVVLWKHVTLEGRVQVTLGGPNPGLQLETARP